MQLANRIRLNKAIPNIAQKLVSKVKVNSPSLLFGTGIVAVVGGTVLACRATMKLSEKLSDFEHEVNDVKTHHDDDHEYKKDLAYVYIKNTLGIVRMYAPPVLVVAGGVVLLTGSHIQLKRRNEALMLAYTSLEAAYNKYRGRVRDVVGEEKERELYLGITDKEIVGENGKKAVVKVGDPNDVSSYSRFFNVESRHWQKDQNLNRMWIELQQTHMNHLLRARGFVFLNEVYEALGIPWSPAGQHVGWLWHGDGDNYIEIAMFEVYPYDFTNGFHPDLLLDFNVDGVILNRIG